MVLREKKDKLIEIYNQFEKEVFDFKKQAVCKMGCADCCKNMATIDITTLEGFMVYERIDSFSSSTKREIKKRLNQNKFEKEHNKLVNCPFLKEDNTCLIYDVRPFSCRWLYSVKRCNGGPPTIHRRVFEIANRTIKEIQRLDSNGYSGHLSFILYLLNRPDFRKRYLSGKSYPEKIAKFAMKHKLSINRSLTGPSRITYQNNQ